MTSERTITGVIGGKRTGGVPFHAIVPVKTACAGKSIPTETHNSVEWWYKHQVGYFAYKIACAVVTYHE